MKPTILTTFICCLFLVVCNFEAYGEDKKNDDFLKEQEKISYVIGVDMARALEPIKDELKLELLLKGVKDQFEGKELMVPQAESEVLMSKFRSKLRMKKVEADKVAAMENTKKGKAYLEANRKKKGVVTTKSGLQYLVVKDGDGPKPKESDKVKVHYKGTTIEGEEFDSSYARGEPVVFPVNGVIPGWTEALLLMKVGSTYQLVIPSELAYGQRGAGPKIGPNSVLVFDVELLSIEQ